jgi:uncharacterized membrane protein
MANRRKEIKPSGDENYVSIWFWMFAQFVSVIPLIGWVMILVWAYTGENESRKNYFRAIIIWWLLFIAFVLSLIVFGRWPEIRAACEQLLQAAFP